MDDAGVMIDLLRNSGLIAGLVLALRWLSAKYERAMQAMQDKTQATEKRCDDERQRLHDIVEKIRDQQNDDQRELLRSASLAIQNNAKALVANADAFGKLVTIHERNATPAQPFPARKA